MTGIESLLELARRESVFVFERVSTDNPFLDHYLRMIADNHDPNDIQAVLNKHQNELLHLKVQIKNIEQKSSFGQGEEFMHALYIMQKNKFIRYIEMAILTAQVFIQEYFSDVDPLVKQCNKDSKLAPWFQLPLIGFHYDKELNQNTEEFVKIKDEDSEKVTKYIYLLQRMMKQMS